MVTGHTSYLDSSGLPTTKAALDALLISKRGSREAIYFTMHSLLLEYDGEILRIKFALSQFSPQ